MQIGELRECRLEAEKTGSAAGSVAKRSLEITLNQNFGIEAMQVNN